MTFLLTKIEERISELRGELILFTKKYNNLEGKHNKLNMIMEELQNDRNQLNEEHAMINKEYHLATLRRNELEQIIDDVRLLYFILLNTNSI